MNEEYRTKDMVLTGYLMYLGYSLIRLEPIPNAGSEFILQDTGGIEKAVQAFWDDEGLVEPKKYWAVVRQIKSRLYEGVQQ